MEGAITTNAEQDRMTGEVGLEDWKQAEVKM